MKATDIREDSKSQQGSILPYAVTHINYISGTKQTYNLERNFSVKTSIKTKLEINLSELIPKLVEISIMRTMGIMAELMKHCIKNLIKRDEIPIPVCPSKPQLYVHATSYIQPQKSWIFRTAKSCCLFSFILKA